MDFIVDRNLPFSTIQHASFEKMVTTLSGRAIRIPSSSSFINLLSKRFENMKMALIDLLAEQNQICITCDVWSSRAQSYLGMTVHFLNDEFERQSYVLAFRELKCKQTNDVLARVISDVLNDFNITIDKVTHIITDGCAAFCKAFKVFGTGSDPLIDFIDFENCDDDENIAENTNLNERDAMPFIQYEDGEVFYSNILHLEPETHDVHNETITNSSDIDDIVENEEPDDFFIENENILNVDDREQVTQNKPILPRQRRCLSHNLNRAEADFEKQLPGRAKTALISTLSKLQSIWVFPRRSSEAKTLCKEILGCTLLIPCETRWNSKYDSMSRAYKLKANFNTYVEKIKSSIKRASHLEKLTNEDWVIISCYLKVMKPLADALDRLQGDKHCGQGYIMPTLRSMKHLISSLEGGNLMKSFVETMLSVIDKRFANYLEINYINEEIAVAAITTPRFKLSFIERDSECDTAKRVLLRYCVDMTETHENELNNERSIESNEDDFYVSYMERQSVRRNSQENDIELEILRFFDDRRKNLEMLNDFPTIKKVFMKTNTTLSSSGPIERVFSQSGLIFTPRRNRISSKNFERTLLLKHNSRLVK